MKYLSKIPDTDIALENKMINNGWRPLKEPKNLCTATIFSLPIAFINVFLCAVFIIWINKDVVTIINSVISESSIVLNINFLYILYIYFYIFLHEIIHMICIPNFIKSNLTFISVKLWGGFVYTEEIINKQRYLLITILPFILLSFVIPLLMTILKINPKVILTLAIINSAGSSIDVLSFFLILFQIPKGSSIKNNGIKTFYLCK